MSEWRVREVTAAELEVLRRDEAKLFDRVSVARSRWLLEENPAGKATVLAAVTPEGRLAGTRAIFPWDLQVDGRRVKVAQGGRSWTYPDFRRQGVSVAIGRGLQRMTAERGLPFLYYLPSDRSIRGHRQLDHLIDPCLQRRQSVISPRFVLRAAPAFLDAPARWGRRLWTRGRASAWIPESDLARAADALWPDLVDRPGVFGVRDGAFVAWRYGASTGTSYRGWRWPASETPRILAVTVRQDRRERIIDTWGGATPRDTSTALAGLVEVLAGGGAWLVDWCPPYHGSWSGVATRAGFIRRRRVIPLARWYTVPVENLGSLAEASRFQLTDGDTDYA